MQEHPSFDQLNLYEKRALGPEQFLAVHRHVAACPKCSEQCGSEFEEKDLTSLISALLPSEKDEPYHLTEAELNNYVDGDADDVTRELTASHLEVCDECARILEKLSAPKVPATFKPFLATPVRPAQITAVLAIGVVLIALLLFWAMRPPAINQSTAGDKTPSPGPANSEGPNAVSTQPDDGQTNPEILRSADLTPSLRKAIQSAWTNQRLEQPEVLAELKGVPGRLLGESSEGVPFQLVSPMSTVVQTRTPTFVWKPLDGAIGYTVVIVDDKLEEVASSQRLTGTRWKVPVSLKRGNTYSWQVIAYKDDQRITSPVLPAPQAKFKILEKSRDDELKRLKQSLPNYHLGLGVFYVQVGMLDEAEKEFQALLKENPSSTAATKLLHSVRSMKQ
jgi:anti-sigma factor ChrR (cupin superfamily)